MTHDTTQVVWHWGTGERDTVEQMTEGAVACVADRRLHLRVFSAARFL